jgi:glucan 1,3-beta-glucosidase
MAFSPLFQVLGLLLCFNARVIAQEDKFRLIPGLDALLKEAYTPANML